MDKANWVMVGIISQMLYFVPVIYLLFYMIAVQGFRDLPVPQSAIMLTVVIASDYAAKKFSEI